MPPIRRSLLAAALALGFSAGGAILAPPPADAAVCAGRPADRALARLFMESNVVATGTLQLAKGEAASAFRRGGYFDIAFADLKGVAGKIPARITVQVLAQRRRGGVSPDEMERLAGKPVLLFLTRTGDGEYLFAQGEKALQPATPQTLRAAEVERDRQWAILKAWKADRSLPHYDAVNSLVADLAAIRKPPAGNDVAYKAARDQQDAIFARLEKLGKAAVPAIVANLDNRRPLAVPQLFLANRPANAVEAMRTYEPVQIVDALAAILNQITGSGFDPIYSGGSEAQRRSAISAWRIYANDLQCYGR